MAITKSQVIPELLKHCPELKEDWAAAQAWMKDNDPDGSSFSLFVLRWLFNSYEWGRTQRLPRFFNFLESLIVDGNAEVRQFAVDAYLEGPFKRALFTKYGAAVFAPYMQPETKKRWQQICLKHQESEKEWAALDAEIFKGSPSPRHGKLFRLRQGKLWGDYGSVLMTGFASLDKESGQLLLDRAGPFAPPIFFLRVPMTGHTAVVTDSFRKQLEASGLNQLTYKPVIKNRIVNIPWHTWDRQKFLPWDDEAELQPERPKGGEPANYILEGSHSLTTASQMDALWELIAPSIPCQVEVKNSANKSRGTISKYLFIPTAMSYHGLFRPDNGRLWFVDEPTRQFFEQHAAEWVSFDEVIER